jgi:hypothetical protein
MTDLDPWAIQDSAYPRAGTPQERLRFLIGYAILAPSGHNTQPWLFRLGDDHVDLLADRTRALPVVDPDDRALVISCGAALGTLEIAMRRFGHDPQVNVLIGGAEPDLLARVAFGGAWRPDKQDLALCRAITERRTTRLAYEDRPLDEALLQALDRAAAAPEVEFHAITQQGRKSRIARLVAEGDQAQFADPRFRRELAAWVHSRRSASRDGMSGANFGMPDLLSGVGAMVIRTFNLGDGVAAKDEAIASFSPALGVLATERDMPADWLAVGRALSRVMLTIAASGATAAYLNQPIEVAALRPRLRDEAGVAGVPQLLFRIGYGPRIAPSVRRPVSAVLI